MVIIALHSHRVFALPQFQQITQQISQPHGRRPQAKDWQKELWHQGDCGIRAQTSF